MAITDKITGEKIEIRRFCLTMAKDKRDIIQNAIELCKTICRNEGQEISDSRSLEFITEEFRQNHQDDINIIREV